MKKSSALAFFDFDLRLIIASFLALLLYRLAVQLPVWFDEIVTKSVLFGLPTVLFAMKYNLSSAKLGFERIRFWLGAFNGLAVGGLFGFLAMAAGSLKKGAVFVPYIFSTPRFWSEFSLAFATAWWESLFFYSFVLVALERRLKNEWSSAIGATLIFLLFHAPVLVLRVGAARSVPLLGLLALFSFGQAIIFFRTRSLASCVISHAFWGMALLVYSV